MLPHGLPRPSVAFSYALKLGLARLARAAVLSLSRIADAVSDNDDLRPAPRSEFVADS